MDESAARTATEVEMVEVWRQQRSAQHRPRLQAARHGAPAGERRERGRGQGGGRPADHQRPTAALTSDQPGPGEAPVNLERGQEHREAGEADTSNRSRRHERQRDPRRERRSEVAQGRQETTQQPNSVRQDKRAAEKRPLKAIDPDNPFAKLMALKARMEEEGRR
jgi:ATP-dependent RNA helicase SUPV3L1/SUV3